MKSYFLNSTLSSQANFTDKLKVAKYHVTDTSSGFCIADPTAQPAQITFAFDWQSKRCQSPQHIYYTLKRRSFNTESATGLHAIGHPTNRYATIDLEMKRQALAMELVGSIARSPFT